MTEVETTTESCFLHVFFFCWESGSGIQKKTKMKKKKKTNTLLPSLYSNNNHRPKKSTNQSNILFSLTCDWNSLSRHAPHGLNFVSLCINIYSIFQIPFFAGGCEKIYTKLNLVLICIIPHKELWYFILFHSCISHTILY